MQQVYLTIDRKKDNRLQWTKRYMMKGKNTAINASSSPASALFIVIFFVNSRLHILLRRFSELSLKTFGKIRMVGEAHHIHYFGNGELLLLQ